MMYTVVPPELLEQQPDLPPRVLHCFSGGLAEVWPDGRMCRLISTDPSLYLDPHFAPGALWQKPLYRQTAASDIQH